MLDISAVVLSYNEELNIARCLSSLDFCREIVVVDSGSTDKTNKIAANFTEKVLYHPIEGHGAQLNWGIEQTTNDWILSLDADEEISVQLKKSIKDIASNSPFVGYHLNRKTFYLGRWIEHSGWYPQYILRLFNKNYGCSNQAAIHKSISVKGETDRLEGDILHYSYRSLSHHLAKINDYTSSIAAERYGNGRRFNLLKGIFAPPAEFLKKYIIQRGFLDGFPGFAVAVTSAAYSFMKQAKLYEISLNEKKVENGNDN
ncbi:MAG: glycosyltransferase family 2 protein [candidate division Zixibacteria bacterium]|nr:glycosyltransferase family 2 protein [Candidatus Tariuqbacter arcticus]